MKSMTAGLRTMFWVGLFLTVSSCGGIGHAAGGGGSPNRITLEEIHSVNASNLYEVVARLRPRWLDVRAQRTFGMDTQVVVVLNRTYLGDVAELRGLGLETAESLIYMTGSAAAGEFALPGDRHVEGVIVIRPRDESH